ncbi:MAG: hypothetical protein Kow0025_22840 [Thermodesulfovibrionales bacterium]
MKDLIESGLFRPLIFALIACAALALSRPAPAAEGPLGELAGKAASFFIPVKGTVVSVEDGLITADVGAASGLKKGMRLTVLREGMPFVHPITKERIGLTEKPVGEAEVVEAGADTSRMAIVSGEAGEGDTLRVSSAKVRALYYPSEDVGWSVSEEFYTALKDTGRFELLDAAPGSDVFEEAERLGAEVAITLSAEGSERGTVLRQRLLRVQDRTTVSEEEAVLGEDFRRRLSAGEEFFAPRHVQFISYDMPFGALLIGSGDVDGDGAEDLAVSGGGEIMFYSVGASLRPAVGGLVIKVKGQHLRMDVQDVDGDGKAEVLVTARDEEAINSSLYGYSAGEIRQIWSGKLYARLMEGKLYAQEVSRVGGYEGPVFELRLQDGGTASRGPSLSLPEGVDIYDFIFIGPPSEGSTRRALMAYEDDGGVALYGEDGARLWRSPEDYGGTERTFKKESPTVMVGAGEWSVPDRILRKGASLLTVKRVPVAGIARGLGYKSSLIMGLSATGPAVQEIPLVEDISGNVLDFAVSGDRLFVLASPLMGFDPGRILKGRSPFSTKFYIYSLKGR